MPEALTLEKMKILEKLTQVEESVAALDESVQNIEAVLFGERGEKGVVGKLTDMVDVAKKIDGTINWIAKLVVGALILAALPALANFINIVLHRT